MKGFHAMLVFGILILSLIQENDLSPQPLVEAHLDLIQGKNQITVTGSVMSDRDISGLRMTISILGDDRRFVYSLFDNLFNLQANNLVTLKDLNGIDITFSLDNLYGKYIVIMKITV
jgi:hypothetical protein